MNKISYLVIAIVVIAGIYLMRPKMPETVSQMTENYSQNPASSTPITSPAGVTPAPISTSTMPSKNFSHIVTIETNKGTIVFETYDADAPNTVQNFIDLTQKKYYDGIIFHRVISGFMIQGGDPTGTGRGGPGYKFADELYRNTESYQKGYVRGTVAMANSGPDTNGSQFFIMHKDYPLQNNYTIFGKVVSGIEVVDAIAASKTDAGDRPLDPIVMKKVTVAQK